MVGLEVNVVTCHPWGYPLTVITHWQRKLSYQYLSICGRATPSISTEHRVSVLFVGYLLSTRDFKYVISCSPENNQEGLRIGSHIGVE